MYSMYVYIVKYVFDPQLKNKWFWKIIRSLGGRGGEEEDIPEGVGIREDGEGLGEKEMVGKKVGVCGWFRVGWGWPGQGKVVTLGLHNCSWSVIRRYFRDGKPSPPPSPHHSSQPCLSSSIMKAFVLDRWAELSTIFLQPTKSNTIKEHSWTRKDL